MMNQNNLSDIEIAKRVARALHGKPMITLVGDSDIKFEVNLERPVFDFEANVSGDVLNKMTVGSRWVHDNGSIFVAAVIRGIHSSLNSYKEVSFKYAGAAFKENTDSQPSL